MAVTYYVALPFLHGEDGISPGQPQECPNEPSAIRRAEAMSRSQRTGFYAPPVDLQQLIHSGRAAVL